MVFFLMGFHVPAIWRWHRYSHQLASIDQFLYVLYVLQVWIDSITMSKTIWIRISVVFPVGVFLVLLGYGIVQPGQIEHLFKSYSYYIILGVCIVWLLNALRLYKQSKSSFNRLVRSNWKGLAICLLITISLCSAVQPHFRILDDEASLLSVSNSLARERNARGVKQAKYSLGRDYIVLEQYVPKRPLLYPFLVHLIHLTRGQHWQNGFLLNAIVLYACLSLVYLALRCQLDDWGAMAGVLLILTNPIFIISARSSGFDFVSTFFFLFSLVSSYIFLRKPSPVSFGFLWCTLLMFSHIRYENIYLFVLIIAFVVLSKACKREFIERNIQLLAWTPTLLLPYIWQNHLFKSFFGDGVVRRAFGLDYLLVNAKRFVVSQGDVSSVFDSALSDFAIPTTAILGAWMLYLGLCRVLYFDNDTNRRFFLLLLIAIGIHLLILLSFYFGDTTLTYMQRTYLPVFSLLVLTPLLIPWLSGPWINTRHIFVAAMILFILYLPVSLYPQRTGLFYPDLEYQIGFLRPYDPRQILIVTAQPIRLSALGFGAINFDYANQNKEMLVNDIQSHSFSEVLAFQRVNNNTKLVEDDDRLTAEFLLEPLATFRIAPYHQMRVSRVATALQR